MDDDPTHPQTHTCWNPPSNPPLRHVWQQVLHACERTRKQRHRAAFEDRVLDVDFELDAGEHLALAVHEAPCALSCGGRLQVPRWARDQRVVVKTFCARVRVSRSIFD